MTPGDVPGNETIIDIRRSADRFSTSIGWLDSKHSFSFGRHHDPDNTGHGLLIVSNDDTVAPGGGFQSHSHQNMEIVTWVLSGQLEHRDSEGNHGVLYPGLAQRMSAGSGITHSEMNHSQTEPVHFVQMWVPPDVDGVQPGYQQQDMNDELNGGGLVTVASGSTTSSAIRINQRAASMAVARMRIGQSVDVPENRYVHVYIARGSAMLNGRQGGEALSEGDAARITDSADLSVTAHSSSVEIIVWESSISVDR